MHAANGNIHYATGPNDNRLDTVERLRSLAERGDRYVWRPERSVGDALKEAEGELPVMTVQTSLLGGSQSTAPPATQHCYLGRADVLIEDVERETHPPAQASTSSKTAADIPGQSDKAPSAPEATGGCSEEGGSLGEAATVAGKLRRTLYRRLRGSIKKPTANGKREEEGVVFMREMAAGLPPGTPSPDGVGGREILGRGMNASTRPSVGPRGALWGEGDSAANRRGQLGGHDQGEHQNPSLIDPPPGTDKGIRLHIPHRGPPGSPSAGRHPSRGGLKGST
ncbi:unnamed protein product [Parnassius apollo]|uniref:(apollo) hypothetical protein n=1 Tax=Parnassius apollo TaxID=110799 RepID=A0A8S3WC59_PARAO|nr:unnamed protein product [Parnassius apollo]